MDVVEASNWSLAKVTDGIKDGSINKIVVISGAGLSVSAGIPDFRSPNSGLFSTLKKYGYSQPQQVFDISLFRKKPEVFYSMIEHLIPPAIKPTKSHLFIRLLQEKGKLLRHYTQNIDPLDAVAGVHPSKLVNAHGSFTSMKCIDCNAEFGISMLKESMDSYKNDKENWSPPKCNKEKKKKKVCGGLLKPSVIFYGEFVPSSFEKHLKTDMRDLDLLIIIGTSLMVLPFMEIPKLVGKKVPRLLINDQVVGQTAKSISNMKHLHAVLKKKNDVINMPNVSVPEIPAVPFVYERDGSLSYYASGTFTFYEDANKRDLLLLGDADKKIQYLCDLLGWTNDLQDLVDEFENTKKTFWEILEVG